MIKTYSSLNVFSPKEEYLMSHDSRGRKNQGTKLSVGAELVKTDNIHLLDGIRFEEHSSMPVLEAYRGSVDLDFHAFKERHRLEGEGQAIHFFMPDKRFAYAVWNRLEKTTREIIKFNAVLAPDFSLFVDAPDEVNRYAVYKSRFVAAYWLRCGLQVIPTASWAGASSLDFCFEGLPMRSVIAVCGTGVRWCRSAWELWCYALRRLEAEKQPTLILVYGEPVDIPGLHTPVKFIESYIFKHFRNEK